MAACGRGQPDLTLLFPTSTISTFAVWLVSLSTFDCAAHAQTSSRVLAHEVPYTVPHTEHKGSFGFASLRTQFEIAEQLLFSELFVLCDSESLRMFCLAASITETKPTERMFGSHLLLLSAAVWVPPVGNAPYSLAQELHEDTSCMMLAVTSRDDPHLETHTRKNLVRSLHKSPLARTTAPQRRHSQCRPVRSTKPSQSVAC